MYEGFEPTKFDIEMAQRSYVEGSPTAEEMLAQIRAAKSTTSKWNNGKITFNQMVPYVTY